MKEFQVAPGRYLVSANMGEGYEQYNDPIRALVFLEANETLIKGKLEEKFKEREKQWSKEIETSIDDLHQQWCAIVFDLYWLKGDSDMVRTILRADKQIRRAPSLMDLV